jgi:hypothetical protein
MEITYQEVQGFNRKDIPDENETVGDFLNLDELAPLVHTVAIYERPKEACPLARGNWVIDIKLKYGQLICIKLPLTMTDEQVLRYADPLIKIVNKLRKDKLN